MTGLLLDTHAWFWFLAGSDRLPPGLNQRLIVTAEVRVSAASVYEIGQKIRHGRWPGMDADALDAMIVDQNVKIVDMTAATFRIASLMDWDHRDPFDRMIAAVAIDTEMSLVSKDTVFDGLNQVERIWT